MRRGWKAALVAMLVAAGGAQAATWYVATNGNDTAAGTDWLTAKQTIQAAIDLSASGDEVLVSNGVYAAGGRRIYGPETNRIAIDRPIAVRSVNGPAHTIIVGARDPLTTNGDAAVRCAYVGTNAFLSGFTLTGGATRVSGNVNREWAGGAAWCDTGAVVSNCVLTGNSGFYGGGACGGTWKNCIIADNAAVFGGGIWQGVLVDCVLTGNTAGLGGGALEASLTRCLLAGNVATNGGGANNSGLTHCRLLENVASSRGGGVYACTLTNCFLARNMCRAFGGGSAQATLINCTLIGNSAFESGGGSYYGALNNCIVYYNTAPQGPNYDGPNMAYCCSLPQNGGGGCITNEPLLSGEAIPHLMAGSPCINAGFNAMAAGDIDLDGDPRLADGAVDMGCDEYTEPLGDPLLAQIRAPWTNAVVGFDMPFEAVMVGAAAALRWDWGDGAGTTNLYLGSHAYAATGLYAVVLSATNASGGTAATVTVRVVSSLTYHAAPGGGNVAPYDTWQNAATSIQFAVDAAPPGAQVLVSNGIYATGGRVISGAMTNRVAIDKPITVRSVNGPLVTFIQGSGPTGETAVRCVHVGSNAVLSGFTLTGGATRVTGENFLQQSGGGLWAETNSVISNCVLTGNSAHFGGGAYRGLLRHCCLEGNVAVTGGGAYESALSVCLLSGNVADNGGGSFESTADACLLTGNVAASGGAVYRGTLQHSTVVHNRAATQAGGVYAATLYNSIVYHNDAPQDANYASSTLMWSCTTPLPGYPGSFTNAPRLAGRANPHLLPGSPCIDAGSTNYATPSDWDGEARPAGGPVDVGCDEVVQPLTMPLSAAIRASWTNLAVGFVDRFEALIDGAPQGFEWSWGDGEACSNEYLASHAFAAPGLYAVVLRATNLGASASVTAMVHVADTPYHVAPGGAHVPPFADWTTAATNIQAAIDAAGPGALVLVSNGVYQAGGRVLYGAMTNRVAVTNFVRVRSVNGPGATVIVGAWSPGSTNGDAAVRCAYVGSNCELSGFTLTNGATRAGDDTVRERSGGGVWCEPDAVVSNCLLTGCAAYSGAGSFGGQLADCIIAGNAATWGGGSVSGKLTGCTLTGNAASYGGGAYRGSLRRCVLRGNAAGSGGGAYDGSLESCALLGNVAGSGGGSYAGTLVNCTLVGNSASIEGGGARGGTLTNCIVYYNSADSGPNYLIGVGSLGYSCTTPLPAGAGNFTNAPQLACATNPHLLASSPCRDAGTNGFATGTDLDGEARTFNGRVDIGCDECTPPVAGPLSARIRADHTNFASGLEVRFEALVDGMPERLRWIWGDGSTTTDAFLAAHAFLSNSTYAVVLQAENSSHAAAATATVTVADYVFHVAPGGAHVPPFATWATAATGIQEAINVASPGARVLVSNGVYATGGRVINGALTNRIAITNAIRVVSVNGPGATMIVGAWQAGATNGDAAVRCAYVGTNCCLAGFTLTNGATRIGGDVLLERSGGGAFVRPGGVVSNCVVAGNGAFQGGGAAGGQLVDCQLLGNAATVGGGAITAVLVNCFISGNRATTQGGGVYQGTLRGCTVTGNRAAISGGFAGGSAYNSIIYFNSATSTASNHSGGAMSYCCTGPDPGGTANLTANPQLAGVGNPHLLDTSPCIAAGNNANAVGADLDGEPRIYDGTVDLGCDEFMPPLTGALTAALQLGPTSVVPGLVVYADGAIEGRPQRIVWNWGDGTATTNLFRPDHAYASAGTYTVVLQVANSTDIAAATGVVEVAPQPVHYVAPGGGHVPPFTDWAGAATNIQAAVDVAAAGALVLVSNGVYASGGRAFAGSLTNRIVITNAIQVRSVNGPAVTEIRGFWDVATNGNGSVRCAYVGTNSTLDGFALTRGSTRGSGGALPDQGGGGALCAQTAVLTNCVLAGNAAYQQGAGLVGGTAFDCVFTSNRAVFNGGGAASSLLVRCTLAANVASNGGAAWAGGLGRCTVVWNTAGLGGGICGACADQCVLSSNTALSGGGAFAGWVSNSLLLGNTAQGDGGGATLCSLAGCTLVGNRATSGGGASTSTLVNCIAYYNEATNAPNYLGGTLDRCATTPLPGTGTGHVTNEPQIASRSNPHLLRTSPCIDAGLAAPAAGRDLDDEPRVAGAGVDIGCDEFTDPVRGPLAVAILASWTNVAPGYRLSFEALVDGVPDTLVWDWGDGAVSSNRMAETHAFAAPGTYPVVLRIANVDGVAAATVAVHVAFATTYVSPAGGHVAPFSDWATAATSIQAAADATVPGGLVLVGDGTYGTGGRVVHGAMTNRLVVTNGLSVRSLNGPASTVIVGAQTAGVTNGDASVRCVYLGERCVLEGFTLTNGSTRRAGDAEREQSGGGVWCETNATVSECVITGNSAYRYGGGCSRGVLIYCTLSGNDCALGGGAAQYATLQTCTVVSNTGPSGGGLYGGEAVGCELTGNRATQGGGAFGALVSGSVLAGNTALSAGGGSYQGTLTSCRFEGNQTAGSGGGAYAGTVRNGIFQGNVAGNLGGGACQALLHNSLLASNTASVGGGINGCWAYGCTLMRNAASTSGGGAAAWIVLANSIVYYNTAPTNQNVDEGAAYNCCTTPLPATGNGNITNEPLVASARSPHLLAGSPCVDAGNASLAQGVDLDGEPRVIGTSVDIGCDEQQLPLAGPMAARITPESVRVSPGYLATLEAIIDGFPASFVWSWDDGAEFTNRFLVSRSFTNAGTHTVVLRASNDTDVASATAIVQVIDTPFHVAPGGGHVDPFSDWTTAATSIQAAVDAAPPGALVLVSNGIYNTGGVAAGGALTSRVAVTKPLVLRSVNGPAVTVIAGTPDPAATNGDAAVRCVYLGSNSTMIGFTLTGGATRVTGTLSDQRGGGAWCEGTASLSNCTVTGNTAWDGGGVASGRLFNCVLTGNRGGSGGGALFAALFDCVVATNTGLGGGGLGNSVAVRTLLEGNTALLEGGGAQSSTLSNCTVRGNTAGAQGGGLHTCVAVNCLIHGNSVAGHGGGTAGGATYHGTIIGNSASGLGGGAFAGTVVNSIVCRNTAASSVNTHSSAISYSCTVPDPGGAGNVTNEPLFVATNDFHLAAGSPCIDAGSVALVSATNDLDGLPRVRFGGVDMGAYEFQTPLGYWAWAAAITNGATGYSQSAAGDDRPNLLKYATGQDATNAGTMSDLAAVWAAGGFGARFLRNTNATDVTLIVEGAAAAADGAPWTGLATNRAGSWGGATNVAEEGTNSPAAVTVRAGDEASTNTFLRLRVTRP